VFLVSYNSSVNLDNSQICRAFDEHGTAKFLLEKDFWIDAE
jgi:hypothetical protein